MSDQQEEARGIYGPGDQDRVHDKFGPVEVVLDKINRYVYRTAVRRTYLTGMVPFSPPQLNHFKRDHNNGESYSQRSAMW